MKCPDCASEKNIVKSGKRNSRKGIFQRYLCRNCKRTFIYPTSSRAHYPENVILYTIEQYNRGLPVAIAKKMTGTKYQYSPPIPTIYSWLKRYEDTLTFIKLRKRYEIDPETLVTEIRLDHGIIYPFRYHDLKLNIHSKDRPELRRYINWIERSMDHTMFLKGPRASSTKIQKSPKIIEIGSRIPEMTRMALASRPISEKFDPHTVVENFFLINDSSTVATELPVFLRPDETDIPLEDTLTGHIDLVQVRFGKVHILDYKPNLNDPKKYVDQLILYKEALQRRTSIPEEDIAIELFNQFHHYGIE